jgi:hypothetical protein
MNLNRVVRAILLPFLTLLLSSAISLSQTGPKYDTAT